MFHTLNLWITVQITWSSFRLSRYYPLAQVSRRKYGQLLLWLQVGPREEVCFVWWPLQAHQALVKLGRTKSIPVVNCCVTNHSKQSLKATVILLYFRISWVRNLGVAWQDGSSALHGIDWGHFLVLADRQVGLEVHAAFLLCAWNLAGRLSLYGTIARNTCLWLLQQGQG